MVAAVRGGKSIRRIARQFRVAASCVKRWVDRAKGKRLDRTDFNTLSTAARRVANRTRPEMEKRVLSIRKQLRDHSDLGEFGAAAIRRELDRRGIDSAPSLRTIGYILQRNGGLDYRHRIRHQPPAAGWYLPEVACGLAELDEFDFVEGLVIRGGREVEVLSVISLHGGLVGSWPQSVFSAESALAAMIEHWRCFGLPDYAQYDNDTRFQGPHQHPDTIGKVIRVCLSLAVVPVFAPPREHGLQNAIESYNGRWQAKVWGRFQHDSLQGLQAQSAKYVAAYRERSRARIDKAPERHNFPSRWSLNSESKIRGGSIIYIRRSSDKGGVEILGRRFDVDRYWIHRLVRCEVDIAGQEIRFYGLRRREPDSQPLLGKVDYQLPPRYIK
jgi:transposase